ncbi:hypothetical protein [Mycobacterium simiae]|uniref:hypothetical protein n=1 Tax=Mycobacterium simiae TaxID=1784 RepID=UPI002619F3DB|nr:hypothetical protein [Mycobacterium simiae]
MRANTAANSLAGLRSAPIDVTSLDVRADLSAELDYHLFNRPNTSTEIRLRRDLGRESTVGVWGLLHERVTP